MKTFVILTRRADGSAETFKQLASAEHQYVWQGLADGIVRAVHGLADGPGAALELESATLGEAKQFVDGLPFVKESLLEVQYWALKPFPEYAKLVSS